MLVSLHVHLQHHIGIQSNVPRPGTHCQLPCPPQGPATARKMTKKQQIFLSRCDGNKHEQSAFPNSYPNLKLAWLMLHSLRNKPFTETLGLLEIPTSLAQGFQEVGLWRTLKSDFTNFHFPNSIGQTNQTPVSSLSFEEINRFLVSYTEFLGLESNLCPQDSAACLDWSLNLKYFSTASLGLHK